MNAREEVLGRIRHALRDIPAARRPDDVPVPRAYAVVREVTDVVELFTERVADYHATVVRAAADEIGVAVAEALGATDARRVVVPPGLPAEWLTDAALAGVEIVGDDPPLSAEALDAIHAVVTAAALGIAVTGTIVLDHGPTQGRRALTLVPDVHVCVVAASQIFDDVPEAVARLRPAIAAGRPLTWVSGPSATSDIELDRVEGVHGPRTLRVVVVDADATW